MLLCNLHILSTGGLSFQCMTLLHSQTRHHEIKPLYALLRESAEGHVNPWESKTRIRKYLPKYKNNHLTVNCFVSKILF